MDKFACSVVMMKSLQDLEVIYEWEERDLTASCYRMWDFIDIEYDLLQQLQGEDKIKALAEGTYFVFVTGTFEFESSVDWESGVEEGNYVLYFESSEISIEKIPDWRENNE